MKVTFGNNTLADDQNLEGQGKVAFILDDFEFDSSIMSAPGYGTASPIKILMGNVDSKISFTAARSFANIGAKLTFLKTLPALVGTQDTLILLEGDTNLTFLNSILRSAREIPSASFGARVAVQYHFELNALKSPILEDGQGNPITDAAGNPILAF